MRPGKEPHGALPKVYVDHAAQKAIIKEKAGAKPDGAVIVEEYCRLDKKLAAVARQDEKRVAAKRPDRRLKNSPTPNGNHGQGSTPANRRRRPGHRP